MKTEYTSEYPNGRRRLPDSSTRKRRREDSVSDPTDGLNTNEATADTDDDDEDNNDDDDDEGLTATCSPLLFHAKVYVFSQRYVVPQLQALSLSKIADELPDAEDVEGKASELIAMIEYTYPNTDRPSPARNDRLRSLIMRHVAMKAKFFRGLPAFLSMLERNGEMGADLARYLPL